MKTRLSILKAPTKLDQMHAVLTGYWENDRWDVYDPCFDGIRFATWNRNARAIDFARLGPGIRDEFKFYFAFRLQQRTMRLRTAIGHGTMLNKLAAFLNRFYPHATSLIDIDYDRLLMQWRSYLIDQGHFVDKQGRLINEKYETLVKQCYQFLQTFFDDRDEFEKDVWDVRRIPGVKFTDDSSNYRLSFLDVPAPFRPFAKKYLKVRLGLRSQSQCKYDLLSLRPFFKFIHVRYPGWQDIKLLSRKDMEDYLPWYRSSTANYPHNQLKYLIGLRTFLTYIQKAEYPEAPEKPVYMLMFDEDMPRLPQNTEHNVKYIPEGVLRQFDHNLGRIRPSEYIPVAILLRASGWRISDILNLRYDKCLKRTEQGWWLCGDIPKTNISNHRIPITEEIAAVVQAVINEVEPKSTSDNNPRRLLFAHLDGKRKGRPPVSCNINNALNRLARDCNIVDDQGQVFHFKNHAFRHTKGVELINNGMDILHVQKWLAHLSPKMTLRYAEVLDTTMREAWEKVVRSGLFRINPHGGAKKIDLSDAKKDDEIEWEYIRYNLDAVRTPLGYCMKPHKIECRHQLGPCLTCRNLCTTPDFISQYELDIEGLKTIIKEGGVQGRTAWVDKNQALLGHYEAILAVMKEGKTHHLAGKKGREYDGEERTHGGNS